MALMTCPDCANQYTDEAPYCPNCGRPNPARQAPGMAAPGGAEPGGAAGTGPATPGNVPGGGFSGGANAGGWGQAGGGFSQGPGPTGGDPAGGGAGPGTGAPGTGAAGGFSSGGGAPGYSAGGPGYASAPPVPGAGQEIPNYLVQSILVTLLSCCTCFIPIGAIALIFSIQVNSKRDAGDLAGAMAASKNAKMACWIALGVCLVVFVINLVFGVLAMVMSAVSPQG